MFESFYSKRFRWLPLVVALGLAASPAAAQDDATDGGLVHDPIGVPMRVRDFTFPSYLILNFAPQPAAQLGEGRFGFEAHVSRVNDFQVSRTVERYLDETRGAIRQPLTPEDADFILGLPLGESYFIDGEFSFYDFAVHYGITDRIDLGVSLYYIDFSGGDLDGTIFDFHDRAGFGQQGRNLVADDQFQLVLGGIGEGAVLLDGPPEGGFSDPSVFLRYAFGGKPGGWRFNLGIGAKVPLADVGPLSSGSADFGVLLAADKRWRRNAFIVNLAVVEPGDFDDAEFDPPALPSVHLVWLHRFGRWPRTRFFAQALAAEHVFRDAFDSDLADPEFQLTFGMKWDTPAGVLGVGLTENLLNYDNTPDIGVHLSWGYLTR